MSSHCQQLIKTIERGKLNSLFILLNERSFIMYKTKKYGTVSCKTENQILAELERDLSKEKRKKHGSTGHNQGKKSDSR